MSIGGRGLNSVKRLNWIYSRKWTWLGASYDFLLQITFFLKFSWVCLVPKVLLKLDLQASLNYATADLFVDFVVAAKYDEAADERGDECMMLT